MVGNQNAGTVDELIVDEILFAEKMARAVFDGQDLPNRVLNPRAVLGDCLISPVGSEDQESTDGKGLQRSLCNLYDETKFDELVASFTSPERWDDLWRL